MSKVYVIGATGGIGQQVVKELLEKNVQVTAFVRDPSKATQQFGQSDNLILVHGDYENLDNFKSTIAGHERLFLLVHDFNHMAKIKVNFAKLAYAAGVKQVVHVSSISVAGPWRETMIAAEHYDSEVGIYNIPDRGAYVTLRPNQFFTNHFFSDDKTIPASGVIYGNVDPDYGQHWVSPIDIAHVAANVLTEDIAKHDDCVYNLTTVKHSGNERAAIFSKVLGKEVKYVQVSVEQRYKIFTEMVHMPHKLAIGLVSFNDFVSPANPALPLLLYRQHQSLEEWVEQNKERFM
ncbi:hypothetical protein BGW37DRAFT_465278 [Umbelopsis sp. PMI_123]|nr:hypothetical protein BGW37DRAFT_465278 [Umbelopsis sp. PMI_123]